MSYIQYLGNGKGYIYAALPDGSKTIAYVEPNTVMGVRNMRLLGAGSAPVSAARSAVGTIQVTAVISAGNITAVTINSVNQIGSPVAATIGDVNQTATDLAAAINAFSPTGYEFTAEAIDDIVYVYSSPQDGSVVNGFTITVTVSNVNIITTTTQLSGGSNQDGVYDTTFGFQFFLDPTPLASNNSISFSAEDISNFIVIRGLQSGIFTESLAVTSTAKLLGITRCSAFTNILTDTNSMNPNSDLSFIDPNGFVQGDVIRLTQFDTSRVVTVYDASNPPQYPANIYLTNADPFYCQDNRSIELRLQYDNTLGAIWVENSRSFVPGPNIVTRAEMLNLIASNLVKIGENYLVIDAAPNYAGIDGIIITGISTNAVSTSGQALFYLPDYNNTSGTGKFLATWNALISSVTATKYYAWNGLMYESLTGVVGTSPDTDAINWALVPITDPTYIKEVHTVQYNLSSNDIVKREDKRGNVTTGTSTLGFRFGDNNVTNNVIQGGTIDQNLVGQFNNNFVVNSTINSSGIYTLNFNSNIVYGTLFSFSNVKNGLNGVIIENNNFTNCQFAINNSNLNVGYPGITNVYGNTLLNGRFKITMVAGGSASITVANNNYTGSYNNSGSQFNLSINTGNVGTLNVINNIINSSKTIAVVVNGFGISLSCNFQQNTLTNIWSNTVNFALTAGDVIGSTFSNLTNSAVTNYLINNRTLKNEFITTGYSTYILDVFAPNYISGTTLTLPAEVIYAGTIRIYDTFGVYNINKILVTGGDYPKQPIKIICGTTTSVTITPTLYASVSSDGAILSDGGAVTISGKGIGATGNYSSDTYIIQTNLVADPSGTIAQPYWIKQYNTQIQ